MELKIMIDGEIGLDMFENNCIRFEYENYIANKKKENPSFSLTKIEFIEDRILDWLIGSSINVEQKAGFKDISNKYNSLKTKRE